MSTKFIIGKNIIDLPRTVVVIPREGEVLHLKLKSEGQEKTYTVYLVEHEIDLNQAMPVDNVRITLKEVKSKGD